MREVLHNRTSCHVEPPLVLEAINACQQFLQAIFAETDTILFRPIETWTEGGKKASQVDYRNTCYLKATRLSIQSKLAELHQLSAENRLNLFFAVCPRWGTGGRFDLAWQIRTVRVLWMDMDHVTVDEARSRITKSGLPPPSIMVNSGNGVHVYWILKQPYLIDDVSDPPAIETEWIDIPGGRKKARKYFIEDGDRTYLDQRPCVTRLSGKAQHFQNLLTGIAKACGGDHTTDLSRLLRLPGTFNRKDQRNGREPIPTVLVEFEASRRYDVSDFERFLAPSASSERLKKIALVPLKKAVRPSTSTLNTLADRIAACAVAAQGVRSEVDFALCCFAAKFGIDKELVWREVEEVGKFAEQGRSYFDRTWENAEFVVRAGILSRLERQSATTPLRCRDHEFPAGGDGKDEATDEGPGVGGKHPTIFIDTANMPVADVLHRLTNVLISQGQCFERAEQLVAVDDLRVVPILTAAELAGLLNQYVEFYVVDGEAGEYKPLPTPYASTWLHHPIERRRLPSLKLFTHNPVYTADGRLVAPGWDGPSGIYYAGPAIAPRDGTQHLDELLRDFCFKSAADRTNFIAMLLTVIMMPRFVGSKPAVLFNGNQPELGKSILAQVISILRDGTSAETASYNPNDEEFEKRLGSIVRRGVTTIIIDNAKSRGRNTRIESACLERSITDPILSFRLLGQSDSIRAENSHIFCITANSTDTSRDLVTRSVVVNLYHEGDPTKRTFSITDPEGYAQQYRVELLGELLGMVERWKSSGSPMANTHSRFNKRNWGNVIGGVLLACGEPDFLANAHEAATSLDDTHRDFSELVVVLAGHPQGNWSASELVNFCRRHDLFGAELGEGSARSQETKMGTIAGRFVNERFPLSDDREATFQRLKDRKGSTYRVVVSESAEP